MTDKTTTPTPAERTSPQETKLAGNSETVAVDEAVERAARALCVSRGLSPDCLHDDETDSYPSDERRVLHGGGVVSQYRAWRKQEPHAKAVLQATGYFALRDERDQWRNTAQLEANEAKSLQCRAETAEAGCDALANKCSNAESEIRALRRTIERNFAIAYENEAALLRRATAVESALAAERETVQSLLGLVADIRKAAGDPTGKLMQDELVAHIAAECERAEANARDARRYEELIMCVGNKYPGETRHETALRYLRQHEQPIGVAALAAQEGKDG